MNNALSRCYAALAKLPQMDRSILMFPLGAMNDTERGRAAEICEQIMEAPRLRAVVEADAALIAELRAENARLREALQVIAQQPKGGEVIGYGPERQAAWEHGFNAALNLVYTAARAALSGSR